MILLTNNIAVGFHKENAKIDVWKVDGINSETPQKCWTEIEEKPITQIDVQ